MTTTIMISIPEAGGHEIAKITNFEVAIADRQTANYIEAWHKNKMHQTYGAKTNWHYETSRAASNWRMDQVGISSPQPKDFAGPSFGGGRSIASAGHTGTAVPKRQAVFTEITIYSMAEKLTEWKICRN